MTFALVVVFTFRSSFFGFFSVLASSIAAHHAIAGLVPAAHVFTADGTVAIAIAHLDHIGHRLQVFILGNTGISVAVQSAGIP